MKYDVRIDGHTIETFDTFEGANAQADKLNGASSLTAPDKKAIVVGYHISDGRVVESAMR